MAGKGIAENGVGSGINEENSKAEVATSLPLTLLQERFGLTAFRPHQEEVITDVLANRDVLLLLPTGAGKSLCYQLPGLLGNGLTVVVFPLLALIADQARAMQEKGLASVIYTGNVLRSVRATVVAQLRYRRVTITKGERQITEVPLPWPFLLTTPETLCTDQALLEALGELQGRQRLCRFVIDESHCIHSWADDFRPSYLQLAMLRQSFPSIPILALTATAREVTIREIISRLGLQETVIHKGSYQRPNLEYHVYNKAKSNEQFYDQIYTLLQEFSQRYGDCGKSEPELPCGIIYCFSRDSCHQLAEGLLGRERQGRWRGKIAVYHAGLSEIERCSVQKEWLENKVKVIVATIAFGLGIDKAEVRFVIHSTMPCSLEAYSQETGRAGRDGLPSSCYLFYRRRDASFLQRITPERQGASLEAMQKWCEDDRYCRVHYLLHYLDEPDESLRSFVTPCGQCDNCDTLGRQVRRYLGPGGSTQHQTEIIIPLLGGKTFGERRTKR